MLSPKPGRERRINTRFDKVFPVVIGSEIYGDSPAVARNISQGGMMVEMVDPLPLGAAVTVHFCFPGSDAEITARAEVKHQYCFNYSVGDDPSRARGIGLRFTAFIEDTEEAFQAILRRSRTVH